MREGISSMAPLPVLEMMPPVTVEKMVVGLPDIDILQLKKVARYRYVVTITRILCYLIPVYFYSTCLILDFGTLSWSSYPALPTHQLRWKTLPLRSCSLPCQNP